MSLAAVEEAQRREVAPGPPVVLGVDVARFGSDATTIALRRGDQVRVVRTLRKRDTMETSGQVMQVREASRPREQKGTRLRAFLCIGAVGLEPTTSSPPD